MKLPATVLEKLADVARPDKEASLIAFECRTFPVFRLYASSLRRELNAVMRQNGRAGLDLDDSFSLVRGKLAERINLHPERQTVEPIEAAVLAERRHEARLLSEIDPGIDIAADVRVGSEGLS